MCRYSPGVGEASADLVNANKGLLHTVPNIAHTRIICSGVSHPGSNSLDDVSAAEIYEY